MNIRWFGHSCFMLTAENGTRILTDPYDETVGYPMHKLEAEILTISHDHFDHNYLGMLKNEPRVIKGVGEWELNGLRIVGIDSPHDDVDGQKRGRNTIFVFEMDGLRIAHLGDLGCIPSDDVIDALGNLDVLFAPIGGTFTIEPAAAREIANRTNANVLIPMHYQTPVLKFKDELIGVAALISTATGCRIHRLNQSECTITPKSLGEDRLLVFDYVREYECETEEE
ncbi:MBL fold metallo-hydrolase [Eubacteriales bacterium OttesenSCG-928-K08]|nr:MBL fold metallo-hydrolase [Eubacteriales bacterium OttesenSCG-928-K08]